MKVVLLSDTHALLHTLSVPDGDMVVHCGDFGFRGNMEEWKRFLQDFSCANRETVWTEYQGLKPKFFWL